MILPRRVHLVISGDIFSSHYRWDGDGATGTYWMEARDAAARSAGHQTAPPQQRIVCPWLGNLYVREFREHSISF